MSMMVSFVLSFFPRDVLDEILNLIESVSEDFPSYFYLKDISFITCNLSLLNQKRKINIVKDRLLKGPLTAVM